jgi:hypothetical protein
MPETKVEFAAKGLTWHFPAELTGEEVMELYDIGMRLGKKYFPELYGPDGDETARFMAEDVQE